MNEAKTCRTMVRPKLEAAGWLANGERFYREQLYVTAGRVILAGCTAKRLQKKIPDYILFFSRSRWSKPNRTSSPPVTGFNRRRSMRDW